MSAVEVFLDETPGETRGAVMRDGRYTHLLIQRDGDAPQTRLGARSIGWVVEINPGLRGAVVDLGGAAAAAAVPAAWHGAPLAGRAEWRRPAQTRLRLLSSPIPAQTASTFTMSCW